MDGSSMDEKRKEHIAYEYLCHLEEAKKWIEACVEDELPPTTELEQALRNGVILCRLGHYYAPTVIPIRRIYDFDEAKYKAKGLHFKHTDNFNFWLNSLANIGLPKIFYPITTDLYDRKNMPRVIYCIHALSLYLHKLGKAPQIEDLLGTATFTEEEISTMRMELDKYGIRMPHFGKIGGILANEMTVDEAAVHAAILAINEALDKDDPVETLTALQNANACLVKVEESSAPRYHDLLLGAKKDKENRATQNGDVEESERDVYEVILTQSEIQDKLNEVNVAVAKEIAEAKLREATSAVNRAIESTSKTELLRSLQSEEARFSDVRPENMQWYMEILSKAINDKAEHEESEGGELSHNEIQELINIANEVADHTRRVDAAVRSVNQTLEGGDADQTLAALQNEDLDVPDLYPENKEYYHGGLLAMKGGKGGGSLKEEEIKAGVKEMNEKAEYDRSVDHVIDTINQVSSGAESANPADLLANLKSSLVDVGTVEDSSAVRYQNALEEARLRKGGALTEAEIRDVVAQVNEEVRQETLSAEAIVTINSTLTADDPQALIEALQSDYAHLEGIQEPQAPHYLTLLKAALAAKLESDPEAALSREEIQGVIEKANAQTVEALEYAKAVSSINRAVESNDPAATLEAIKAPTTNIRSITDSCTDTYLEKLSAARQEKVDKGVSDNDGWSAHHLRGGYTYYHNSQTGEGQWAEPQGFTGESCELSKDEIQAVVTKVTADYDRWTLMQANEPLIIQIQARVRGARERRPYKERLEFLSSRQEDTVKLQAAWKGFKQRKAYTERLDYLSKQTAVAVKIQSIARMWKTRAAYKDRLKYFKDHETEVVKIQAFMRAKKAKKEYTQLVQVTQPPASTVRKFLALLEQSDIDFSEEIECQRLKAKVVQSIRSNQQQEQDLNVMDIKIGLLVKNRITLQDVVTTSQQVKKKDKKHNRASMLLDGSLPGGVGGFSRANQEMIENYQHLFYLLQTHPIYLAKLLFEMPQNKTNRFMENVILAVFNYAQNNREQYLLIKLFDTALREEIELKVDKIMDIVTGNPTVIKMVIHYTRGERGQNVLRDLLGPLIQEVLDMKDLQLYTSPVDIYRAWINQMETQTGEATKLPYDVSNDQALEHEPVRQKVAATVKALRDLSDRFQQSIFDSVNKIPYAMRYIAMKLRQELQAKFPEAPEDDIIKVVGNLLYYRYMNPAIVAPDAFDVVDAGMDNQLSTDQRRNLGSIAKVLQHSSAGKMFEAENAALSVMNPYIQEAFKKFREFFLRASTVDPPDKRLGIDEYSDVTMLTKPIIYISVKEICSTHSLLIDHEESIAPDSKDPIHEILKDLGPSPSVEALVGGVRETAPGEDKQDLVNEAGKQEIPLTLTNKVEKLAEEDESTNMKALFVRTKRMAVDVLKVQPGENLTTVLYTPATPEQEEEHQELVKKMEQAEQENLQRSLTIMKKSESSFNDRSLPLEGMKRKIMRNLRTLEQEGLVNSKNDYQEIINAIAQDIRNQHRYRQQRKEELTRLNQTLDKLNKKASFYEEQMDFYQQYVRSCLDQLALASSKGSKKATEGFKKQTVKYNAHKLFEKGVVLEIEGLPNHQFRNVVFEITSVDVGKFEVSGRFLGRQIEKVELVFQDLLQLQYEGLAIMKMFGRAKVNVNLLIFLINKKFYGRVA
ncbi:ras GTPase-activating-like protein IQGAP1 isoform X3 [Halichondria panicea]